MFNLFLIIISYGALLVLLMPATCVGILAAAALFALGTALIILKKDHITARKPIEKNKQYRLALFSIFCAVYWGMLFYKRWIPHQWFSYSKLYAIASMLHMSITTLLLITSPILTVLSVYFIYFELQLLIGRLRNRKKSFARGFLSAVFASILMVISAQIMSGTRVLAMGYVNFLWNALIVMTTILFLYCLFGRIVSAISAGSGIFMLISTINMYVYRFRQGLFEPVDIFSAGTAINVMDSYSLFPISLNFIIGWSTYAIVLLVICYLNCNDAPKLSAKRRLALLTVCIVNTASIYFYSFELETYH